ncbi:hypothetical protein HanLR1_Chr00c1817g0821591 [Helianthus annuus]|uniref:Uncharacterized protein n=1 Tax=Helianthus annuus TaxID=4232 RepID=A0A251VAI4_HELAN|nr:hypothetical protein HanLR1_Chr03g0115301 [Helianthus annuus]KAJ0803493.1 hypothetical protein HanLR1_Chr00c1817g0821591 [Helianthus annuus]
MLLRCTYFAARATDEWTYVFRLLGDKASWLTICGSSLNLFNFFALFIHFFISTCKPESLAYFC